MNTYWWRLSRPGWTLGAVAVACGVGLGAFALGWADDVDGTCWTTGRIGIVLASAVAAPLRDLAAPVLDATPYRRRLRRLAPPACAVLTLVVVWLALAAMQATRVPGVPWGGLAVEAVGMAAVASAVGVFCAGRADPGLVGAGVLVLIVLIAETTGIGPWLTAWPGPHWQTGRIAWAVLAVVAALVLLAGLRDPARRGRQPSSAFR
jgi:hypothetical protein